MVLKKSPSRRNGFISFLSTALIIILPKCPFCIAAYSGAFLMFYEVDNAALAPIFTHFKPLLGILVLGSILLNFKGRKSQIAIAITALALIFLLMSVYASIDIIPTWMVYSAFFIGAWYNGNFEYFYRFINKRN